MRRLAALLVALALIAPTAARAATLEVTSTQESGPGSLGAAILEAETGDTIELGPGEFLLTNGEYLVAKGLTLRGAGADATTIIPSGAGDALEDPAVTVVDATEAEPLQAEDEESSGLETKVQIVALIGTLALFVLVLDLVRRRRLAERYALLWMFASAALLVLAVWRGGLDVIANAMGVEEPANAIFILAFGVAFLLLLNFSVVTTRLSEETKILAQESARLEQELRAARGETPNGNGASARAAEQPERERSDAQGSSP
jgi:hypothetical protein